MSLHYAQKEQIGVDQRLKESGESESKLEGAKGCFLVYASYPWKEGVHSAACPSPRWPTRTCLQRVSPVLTCHCCAGGALREEVLVTDGQRGAGRLAAEGRRQADAAVYLPSISAAVLGEKILT